MAFSNRLGNYLNFVDSLKSQHQITDAVFGLYLNDNLYGDLTKTDPEANIIIGGYDLQYASENLTYVRIYKTSGFWFSDLTSLSHNGNVLNKTSKYVLFDSASSTIKGPEADISLMVNLITAGSYCYNFNGYNFCYCKDTSKYPKFTFTIDGHSFDLGPEYYMIKASGWCMVLMEAFNGSAIVLSQPFLRKYYSVFDMDRARVGLALAKKSVVVKTSNSAFVNFGVFVGLGVGVFFIVKKIFRRKDDKDYRIISD